MDEAIQVLYTHLSRPRVANELQLSYRFYKLGTYFII